MKKTLSSTLAVLAFLVYAGAANATLIGDEIIVRDDGGDAGVTCTVGTDCNGQGAVGFDGLIVDANSIFIDVSQHLYGNHLEIRDLDWVGVPGGILVDVELSFTGIFAGFGEPSILIVYDHGFDVTFFHEVPNQGETITFNLITNHTVNHTVPEPATLALLGLGLAGMGLARRRKRA